MSAGSNISFSFRALCFWSFVQVTAGSNVLGSFIAFCYKFYEQVTTGANVWRFLVYDIFDFDCKSCCGNNCYISFRVFCHWFCAQMTARAVMISAGNCIKEWYVWRPSFCLTFSPILPKWLLELAFFLDHFTSFKWNCFSLVLIRFSCCFPQKLPHDLIYIRFVLGP